MSMLREDRRPPPRDDKRARGREDKRLQFVSQEQRIPLTPQLALRVAILGTLALAMFAIVFFRLWFLQVLSGDKYVAAANTNRVRTMAIPAPRGRVLDRGGTVLVDSTPVPAVVISPPDLPVPLSSALLAKPPQRDTQLYDRLASVLGRSTAPVACPVPGHGVMSLSPIACQVDQKWAALPYANVTIQTGVNTAVQDYLLERRYEFPGVQVEQVWQRTYPLGSLAGQLFGTVGPINPTEIHQPHYSGASESAIVGQSGLEYYYDHYLRGADGANRVQIDAMGNYRGNVGLTAPVSGDSLKLSLDVKLQQAGQTALQQSIDSNPPADSGAFVAMNPVTGDVYAMGSLPTFDPTLFTHPFSKAQYRALNNPASNHPLINRAIQSAGPTGSTFKPITAIAALQSGVWTTTESYDDTGQFCEGGGVCRRNAGGAANGVLDLEGAIRVSDDVFFYNLGALLNKNTGNGGELQKWAHALGVGHKTGIDLGGEVTGNLPSPAWRAKINRLEVQCEHGVGPFAGKGKHSSCGLADGRPWSEGDNVNLGVGQGDVQVTPLQLAIAYSTIANGGTVVSPHVGLELDSPDGSLVQKVAPPPARRLNIDPSNLATIRAGLHDAAQTAGGTSYDVMGTFPEQVYGKTGTAQYNNQQDYAWYACFVPPSATSKPITVVVTVPQGGFGAVAAAPVARQILSQWFFGNRGQYTAGSSRTL